MYRRMIATLTMFPVAVLLGAGTARATECFLPRTHYDPKRGYCAPDDYDPSNGVWPRQTAAPALPYGPGYGN